MPPVATSDRRGRDGTRTRARIEEAALRLFAARGVAGTSVREIAEAVGVSEGALYRHFASKEELARALFLDRYASLAQSICEIGQRHTELSPRLRAVIDFGCQLFDDEPALFAYLLINQHDHLAHVPDDPARNAVAALAELLAGSVDAGFELPQPPALAAAMALGLLVQPAVFALYGRLDGPLSRHAPTITEGVLRLLRAPAFG
ncbi:TetR/AcrR family transcriptional regulator [Ancylobacter defluvii]|uniref:TetR family transcriptional regulator n=1 Tax=Ancylobacter defluvii TaxID=1282440 RepID=A0A9W6NBZ3_9HYPH|nr:TetR/AcrR family transcriptional regulator [Ancylobacter defluvii]MBS7589624.1 TetR/AcrR family transcriptional regulator [Ancylobacter defluvii]GLK85243.1 TetR family transcriptional regulator [Ancylobacter defluvii]